MVKYKQSEWWIVGIQIPPGRSRQGSNEKNKINSPYYLTAFILSHIQNSKTNLTLFTSILVNASYKLA